ncbi:hypothetical protein [Klebsiella oxytoca]|uniref:hypothetical protein n=1 Tax=Klebsiella oxytoca TaxID=571 RepID=UPI00398237FC
MLSRWISGSFPAIWIGLFIGAIASAVHVDTSIQKGIAKAAGMSPTERTQLIIDISSASADELESRLQDLHSNEIRVEKHFTTEVIKPVFTNVCASDEYVRLFNDSAERAESRLSGKHDADVPGTASQAER